MADPDDILKRYGPADPRWLTPEDLAERSLHPRAVNQFAMPPKPRAVAETDHTRPDAYVDKNVREFMPPSMFAGAYGLGRTLGTAYGDLRMGDYANAAHALPEIAMAMAPMPGAKKAASPLRVEKPIRAYHGTTSERPRFDPHSDYEIGPHFGSLDQAHARLAYRGRKQGESAEFPDNASVVPVDIKLKNPLEIADPGMFDAHNLPFAMERTGQFSAADIKRLKRHEYDLFDVSDDAHYRELTKAFHRDVQDVLRRNGFDGFKYRNTAEHPEINKIMAQIESAPDDAAKSELFKRKADIEKELETSGDWSYVPMERQTVKSALTGDTLFSGAAASGVGITTADLLDQYYKGRNTDPDVLPEEYTRKRP